MTDSTGTKLVPKLYVHVGIQQELPSLLRHTEWVCCHDLQDKHSWFWFWSHLCSAQQSCRHANTERTRLDAIPVNKEFYQMKIWPSCCCIWGSANGKTVSWELKKPVTKIWFYDHLYFAILFKRKFNMKPDLHALPNPRSVTVTLFTVPTPQKNLGYWMYWSDKHQPESWTTEAKSRWKCLF